MRRLLPCLLLLAGPTAAEPVLPPMRDRVASLDAVEAPGPEVRFVRADLRERTGRRDEALADLDAILAVRPGDLRALAARGRLLARMGREEEAAALFASFPDRVRPDVKDAEGLTALAVGCQEHAQRVRDKALLKQVMSTLYTQAQAADPACGAARREAGFLFASKHQYQQAAAEFESALKIDPTDALSAYGLAMVAWGQGNFGGAQEACRRALAIEPELEEARLLLAGMALWDDEDAEAAALAREVLALNPLSRDALALLAAGAFLAGDEAAGQARMREAERASPGWSGLYLTLGGAFEVRHRASAAIAWYQRGLRLHPEDPELLSQLGMVLVHESREPEGRALLEKAHDLDPFDSRVTNILNLLDEVAAWPSIQTRHFRIRCHPDEFELLGALLAESLERDYAELTALYGYEPRIQPIDVEMYNDQSDFSVRTTGHPVIGALGVCFGRFVAVDSPAVQDQVEPFHWADVARHEFCHVVTLQMSEFRVPRWFTEGLSVYAERHPNPARDQFLVDAAAHGRILPMAALNKAFSRPAYPGQTQLAYTQGGEIVRFIAETRGFDAIKRMLKAYRQGGDTPAVLRDVLGLELADFDREFGAALRERLASFQSFPRVDPKELQKLEKANPRPPGAALLLARQALMQRQWAKAEAFAREAEDGTGEKEALLGMALLGQEKAAEAEPWLREAVRKRPGHYLGHHGLGRILQGRGELAPAVEAFRKARTCFPGAVSGDRCPYRLEAACCFSLGRLEEGIEALKLLVARSPLDTPARLEAARALRDAGRLPEALALLDQGLFADVSTLELHRMRAALLERLGRGPEAAAALALGSHAAVKDVGMALEAAEAWLKAGDPEKARRFASRAREAAPADPRVRDLLERLR